ncbi:hypothetical protein [Cupriavidus pauculus]|uniref:hypothetical protein n=1 Tax=Cupriavidus pauculus TaxID=82633 RepID=UPI00385731A7
MGRFGKAVVVAALSVGSLSAFGADQGLRQPKKAEMAAITQAVKDQVKDPDSVKLRGVMAVQEEGVTKFCGEVNAKNSFGGYVGFKPFYAFMIIEGAKPVYASVSGLGDDVSSKTAMMMCQKLGYEPRA